MTEPTTEAGRAEVAAYSRWFREQGWSAEGWDSIASASRHAADVLAIEAQAAAKERERIRAAVQRIPDDEVADIDVVAREAVLAAIEGASE